MMMMMMIIIIIIIIIIIKMFRFLFTVLAGQMLSIPPKYSTRNSKPRYLTEKPEDALPRSKHVVLKTI
jgi:hypothetical protein